MNTRLNITLAVLTLAGAAAIATPSQAQLLGGGAGGAVSGAAGGITGNATGGINGSAGLPSTSGATGMAGGDHLHFTMLVDGQMVNPVEWWDAHWIADRVTRKLDALRPTTN
jgi:hypothetical protein